MLRNQKPLKARTENYSEPLALFLLALEGSWWSLLPHPRLLPPVWTAGTGQDGQHVSWGLRPEVLDASPPAWTLPQRVPKSGLFLPFLHGEQARPGWGQPPWCPPPRALPVGRQDPSGRADSMRGIQ